MGNRPTLVIVLSIAAIAAFGLFALYGAIYWTWATATPLAPEQIDRARYNAYSWFWLFAGSAMAVLVAIILWVRTKRRDRRQQ